MNPWSNRKRIRGWKRRVRMLDRLGTEHASLDTAALQRDGVRYLKLWLDPFDRLAPREPPMWFRQRAVQVFAGIMRGWQDQLERDGVDYYLAMWLFHPRFHMSQVVAAAGERLGFYRNVFEPAPLAKPAPPAAYLSPLLARVTWQAGEDNVVLLAEDVDDAERARATRIEHTRHGDLCIYTRGTVWTGTPAPLQP